MIDRIAKKSKRYISLALFLMAIGTLGAWLFQTSFGTVSVKQISWETSTGYSLNGILLTPKDRQEGDKLPAVVTTHGWFNTKEMQDLNYVELSRRGFVVLALDMYGHGGSEIVPEDSWFTEALHGNGVYDAVDYLAHLDYVDSERIGVTGHSNGALASNIAVAVDDQEDERLISSVLLVGNDGFYTSDGNQSVPFKEFDKLGNYYQVRDVGIIAPEYDDFFFRVEKDREQTGHTAPREFINQITAQSFLAFGEEPSEERSGGTLYRNDAGTFRVIYPIKGTHTWAHFSQEEAARVVEFFDESLGAPKEIPSDNQIWTGKIFFNAVGLIGFLIFFTNFMIYMSRSKFFAPLKRIEAINFPQDAQFRKMVGRLVIATGIFTVVSFYANTWTSFFQPSPFKQLATWVLGMWSLTLAIFIFFGIHRVMKKSGHRVSIKLIPPVKIIQYTVALAVVSVAASYAFVFMADYFFQVDFRIWLIALRAFEGNKLMHILVYLPFYLLFYLAFGLLTTLYRETRKRKIGDVAISLIMSIPLILMVVGTYGTFFTTGYLPHEFLGMTSDGGILGIWLFVTSFYIFATTYIGQKVAHATKNIYLASIASALLITIMQVTNTLTVL